MANDTTITIQGWVASAPVVREAGGAPVINFRVGCTPRRYQRSTGGWVDGDTQWYSVSGWSRLATHAAASLAQGDAVVVHGRLQHRSYRTRAGVEALSLEIEATTIGHDLTRGTSSFAKGQADPVAETATEPVAERVAERAAEPAA